MDSTTNITTIIIPTAVENVIMDTPPASLPIVFWLIISMETIVIIVGNGMLCWLFVTKRKLRIKQNYFVLSLSISDLLVGLTVGPCEYCVLNNTGLRSNCAYFCGSVLSFNMFASIINLVLIAGDRYFSVMKPFRYNEFLSGRRAVLVIMCGWILNFALTSIPFTWIFVPSSSDNINLIFTISMFACVVVVGFLLGFVYYKIVRVAKAKLQMYREKASNPAGIKVCIIVAVNFFICWTPTCVTEILLQNNISLAEEAPFIAYIILLVNPCLDPLLYAYYRKDFRKELSKISRSCKTSNRMDRNHNTLRAKDSLMSRKTSVLIYSNIKDMTLV